MRSLPPSGASAGRRCTGNPYLAPYFAPICSISSPYLAPSPLCPAWISAPLTPLPCLDIRAPHPFALPGYPQVLASRLDVELPQLPDEAPLLPTWKSNKGQGKGKGQPTPAGDDEKGDGDGGGEEEESDDDSDGPLTCELLALSTTYAPKAILLRAVGGNDSNPLLPKKVLSERAVSFVKARRLYAKYGAMGGAGEAAAAAPAADSAAAVEAECGGGGVEPAAAAAIAGAAGATKALSQPTADVAAAAVTEVVTEVVTEAEAEAEAATDADTEVLTEAEAA